MCRQNWFSREDLTFKSKCAFVVCLTDRNFRETLQESIGKFRTKAMKYLWAFQCVNVSLVTASTLWSLRADCELSMLSLSKGNPAENGAQDFPASLTKVLEKEEEIKIKTFSRGKLGKLYRQWYRKTTLFARAKNCRPHCTFDSI